MYFILMIITVLTNCEKVGIDNQNEVGMMSETKDLLVIEESIVYDTKILNITEKELMDMFWPNKETVEKFEKEKRFKSFGTKCDEVYWSFDFSNVKSVTDFEEFAKENSKYVEIIMDKDGERMFLPKLYDNPHRYLINDEMELIIDNKKYELKNNNLTDKNGTNLFSISDNKDYTLLFPIENDILLSPIENVPDVVKSSSLPPNDPNPYSYFINAKQFFGYIDEQEVFTVKDGRDRMDCIIAYTKQAFYVHVDFKKRLLWTWILNFAEEKHNVDIISRGKGWAVYKEGHPQQMGDLGYWLYRYEEKMWFNQSRHYYVNNVTYHINWNFPIMIAAGSNGYSIVRDIYLAEYYIYFKSPAIPDPVIIESPAKLNRRTISGLTWDTLE